MGKKKKKNDDEGGWVPMSPDYPPLPPPTPEGGWVDPVSMVYEDINAPPPGGYNAPMPDDPLDIRRLDLRVGKITFAMKHPNDPERLMLTYVNVGEPFPRPVVSDIGRWYTKEDLEKRKVVAMCNVEPHELKNIGNTAMLMCATAASEERHELWDPPPGSKVGEELKCEDYPFLAELTMAPEMPFMHNEDQVWEQVAADLRVNQERQLVYKDTHRLFIKGREGFVTTPTLADCSVKITTV